MFHVTREIDFCYGHRLLNYEGKCRHLHGHNGKALITLESSNSTSRGMVLDFGDIKAVMNTWVDDNLDHRMILCRHDPAVELLKKLDEPMYLLDENPTAENIARLIFDVTAAKGFPVVEVRLWETPRCYAAYKRDPVVCGSGIPVRHRLHEGNMGQGTAWRKRRLPGAGIGRVN